MTIKIGKTFAAELAAAGLAGAPLSWAEDGSSNLEQLTPAQVAAFKQVLAAHDPQKGELRAAAIAELAASDATMLRIVEAVALGATTFATADVQAWPRYRRSLRAIAAGQAAGPLPARPAFPAGT